ncbi:MAG TPA: hypothetical protein VGK44_16590 [Casimicrobiaceae bacterium]|jgi:hypothetical protein
MPEWAQVPVTGVVAVARQLGPTSLSVGFRYEDGTDQKALFSCAERIRDELQRRIPSVEGLVELDS